MNILSLNAGSNSLKFEIIGTTPQGPSEPARFGTSLLSGAFDDIGKPDAGLTWSVPPGGADLGRHDGAVRDHAQATERLIDWIAHGGAAQQGVRTLADIDRIAHRVVHGGRRFTRPTLIDEDVMEGIEALADLAPLHNPTALHVIRRARDRVRTGAPMIAIFDSAFHRTLPDEAALYALPETIAERHKIRRYGFHGTSHHYLLLRYAELARRPPGDATVITLHLEGGSSAAAIRRGESIDTSMGFTPLEGLMMGTRSGDLDPAIVTYLMRKEGWSIERTESFLNHDCGLLGVSGRSADTRELSRRLEEPRVNLALDMFCYRVRKTIGAYLAVLGGAEAIVFGGGIGENTSVVRERICEPLAFTGARLDPARNESATAGEALISRPDSSIRIWVIPAREALMMAKYAADLDLA